MYQALYRKWRPRTFDEVVGQSHITDTLKQQVLGGRLSHAYLFTGTRGTGKTSCAKILARAINCQSAEQGNPCNCCPACIGIENGSILDVLELDAASNNGVDQVRALRDEAVYTPAAVSKRVYIVDEVHMLSTPAFNALLKILEEPPPHLVFILATTELHKVPATIKSRCQQFSFKRILPVQIAQQLSHVAEAEGIPLTPPGAALLARLADGGMRDALSLLDQCAGGQTSVDESCILDTLGLAGNVETAALMGHLAQQDTAAALACLGGLYANGKDVGSVLGELSTLSRDLLLRKTAPQGGSALLTGGYDEGTMRALGEQLTAQRLLWVLTQLQQALANLPRSSNRRTDGELCLIRLCDAGLDESLSGLATRVARLEERLAQGAPPSQAAPQPRPAAPVAPPTVPQPKPVAPPWEQTPPVVPAPAMVAPAAPVVAAPARAAAPVTPIPPAPPAAQQGADRAFWGSFVAGLRGKVSPSITPYLNNAAKVTGVWNNGLLTLWTDSEFTRSMLNKPPVLEAMAQAAAACFGGAPNVNIVTGTPPAQSATTPAMATIQPPVPEPQPSMQEDALDTLLAFGAQFDNVTIE